MLLNFDIQFFSVKFLLLLILFFVFFSRNLFKGRSLWRCNKAWHYVIQLEVRLCSNCFKFKYLFLLHLHLVENYVKNVDKLGSEHYAQTHINEPPCLI